MDNAQQRFEQEVARLRIFGTDMQRWEVKEAAGGLPRSLGNTLSAFANTSGGVIVLGVSEKQGFAPVKNFKAKVMQDAFGELCSDGMVPPLRPDIDLCLLDGSAVLVARISELPPRDKPCYVKSKGRRTGSYVRTGDGDRRMTDYEVDRLLEEHEQPQNDARIVRHATLEDLDTDLVAGLIARERAVHPRVSGNMDDMTILQNFVAVVLDEDGVPRPSLGGLAALGRFPQKYYPRLCVTFAAFPGTSKADIGGSRELLDSETIVGPIPAMVADTVAAVRRNMRTGGVIEGAFRKDVVDYPLEAVREAVTNALMHRDYSDTGRGMQVQVNLYADRLEITNPGGLYGTLTLDRLGEPGASATRNQHLSLMLEETPYPDGGFVAENRGTGYQRIVAELAENLMPPPEPESSASQFVMTFKKRRIAQDEQSSLFARSVDAAIIEYLGNHTSVSTKELAEVSGLSRASILAHLNKLMQSELVEPLYPSRSPKQRYRLSSHS